MASDEFGNARLQIPGTPGEITPELLTRILRDSGTLRDSAVESLEVEEVPAGSGFVGQAAHLKLNYDKAEAGVPTEMFAKLSSSNADVRAKFNAIGFYETETGFYRDLSEELRLRVPRAYASHYDPQTGDSLLLLENIQRMRFGDNLAGSTLEEARVAVVNLARMQGHYWESDRLKQCEWLRDTDPDGSLPQVYRACLPVFEKRWHEVFTFELMQAARSLGGCLEAWFDNLAASPFTLTHGDFRPDNFAFDESGEMVLFDWATARRSATSRDLAFFITIALPVAIRRAHEKELLELYYQKLLAEGIDGYCMEQLWCDYRRSLGSPLFSIVISGAMLDLSSERGTLLAKALCERVGSAVEDHDLAAWLPAYLRIGH